MKIMKRKGKPQIYTVKANHSKYPSFRTCLHKDLGLTEGQETYQFLRDDGVIEIHKAENVDLSEYE